MGKEYENPPIIKDDPGTLALEAWLSQGNANVTSRIEAVLNRLRSERIVIPQPAAVREYLLRYPDITDLIPLVCNVAGEKLAISTQLSLEVYCDREVADEYLTLYVRQDRHDEHILDVIESIRAEYQEKLAEKSGWFLVTTDFRHPK